MTSAVILAAGRGSRLGAMTSNGPKCLVKAGGRQLLQWQLEALRGGGATRIGIVAGWRAQRLAGRADHDFVNPDWDRTNMVQSLFAADAWLSAEPVLVAYSDLLYTAADIRSLLAARGPVTISYDRDWAALWCARFDDPCSDAESFRLTPAGDLAEIGGRIGHVAEAEGQFMGLIRFEPAGWAAARSCLDGMEPSRRARIDVTALLRAMLAAGQTIHAVRAAGPWCEIDSAKDLAVAERLVAEGGFG